MLMFRKESIFSSKGPMLKNEFGVEVGGVGVWMGVCKYWGGFLYPPNPSQQNHFMHPPPQEGRKRNPTNYPALLSKPIPNPPLQKNAHAHALALPLTLTLFFLHLPPHLRFLFFNYLTLMSTSLSCSCISISISVFFFFSLSLPSSPSLNLFLSLSLILCFSL